MPTVVQSLGSLADYTPGWQLSSSSYGSLTLYNEHAYDYATLYKTQPNVRTCVDFLARNVAQLGLHVFERVSETDRQRLRTHPLARTIEKPNPWTTRYRLIESLVADLGVYHEAYWLKVRVNDSIALLRVPPNIVTPSGGLVPTAFEINLGGRMLRPTPEQIVYFRGYNPESTIRGLSPLETLRRVLAEEFASGDYREYFWRNAARMNGVIERPREAPEWSDPARERFKAEFEALYSGSANSGKTAILEEGMSWKQTSFSAQEAEYLAGRKLTREECARAYHIPLPMVGLLDNANFSNMREAHKQLYQDSLGPILVMIAGDIMLQLVPDFPNSDSVYVEFNIAEKLAGSFEEQTQALQSAVGRPWMTANEARARVNLPSMDGDAEQLVTPLNVLVGGQASPRDSAPKAGMIGRWDPPLPPASEPNDAEAGKRLGRKAFVLDPTLLETRQRHIVKWREVLAKYFTRQEASLIGRVRDNAGIETVWQDGERWDNELSADLLRLALATAKVWVRYVAEQLSAELDEDRMTEYLMVGAERAAQNINVTTQTEIAAALMAEIPKDAVKRVFEIAKTSRSEQIATRQVTATANFGTHEGAKQGGLRTKTWQVNSSNPRDAHALMNGETVGIGDLFSNGMRWPGDPAGGADNNANCLCSLSYGR